MSQRSIHLYLYFPLSTTLINSATDVQQTDVQRPRLVTTDLRALSHILQHHDVYQKHPAVQRGLASIVGWGVLLAEGERHRVQRKALNPAFGPAQLREQTRVFLDKANEACIDLHSDMDLSIEPYISSS
jgi:cytochrome P450